MEKMQQCVALFDGKDAPSVEALDQAYGQFGITLSNKELQAVIADVEEEKSVPRADRVLPADFEFSWEVAGPQPKGKTKARRSWRLQRGQALPETVTLPGGSQLATVADLFNHTTRTNAQLDCLGTRAKTPDGKWGAYSWLSYQQVGQRARRLAAGLARIGVARGDLVGMSLNTCEEAFLTFHANSLSAVCTVPVYGTLGPAAVRHIVSTTGMRVCVASAATASTLLKAGVDTLKTLVLTEAAPLPLLQAAATAGVALLPFQEVLAAGQAAAAAGAPALPGPRPDDLVLLCFTSGTTGAPKGAMHTHRGMVAAAAGLHPEDPQLARINTGVKSGDTYMSFLPMAHIMELYFQQWLFMQGCRLGFYHGVMPELMDDVKALEPSIFMTAPRVLTRVQSGVKATLATLPAARRALVAFALQQKARAWAQEGRVRSYWDPLGLQQTNQSVFGGRLARAGSGSAPVPQHTLDFCRLTFSLKINEGYGCTEAVTIANTDLRAQASGDVGGPVPAVEMCLEDVPELSYMSTDQPHPRGEVCVRGPTLMKGYWKDPHRTAAAIDADGWYHTGDIGVFLPNGTLKIVDRKKNLFKLSQGEYVAPEKIENVLSRCPFVMSSFVHGDSIQSCLVAVVVPDPGAASVWAAQHQSQYPAVIARPDFVKAVLADITRVCRESGLKGFEIPKAIQLLPFRPPSPFPVTPTLKLKRQDARTMFRKDLDALYASLATPSKL